MIAQAGGWLVSNPRRLDTGIPACYKCQPYKGGNDLLLEFGIKTDQGRVRTSNEDSYAANSKRMIFLVADGMGGHVAGEVASQIAAATIEEVVASNMHSDADVEETLKSAVIEANRRIYQTQLSNPELAGMGSTLTAMTFKDDQYYVAQVGDSRAYLWRDARLRQITRDHSLVWQLFDKGLLSKDELPSHPQKNLITRSIGPHEAVEVDIYSGESRIDDIFLLCSDGLTDMLTDSRIEGILARDWESPQELCQELVSRANEAGGPDNITVIAVRLAPESEEVDD